MRVYKWKCSDVEVTEEGYFLAKDDEDANSKAKEIALTDECLEIELIMEKYQLEELVIYGKTQTSYSDWDD